MLKITLLFTLSYTLYTAFASEQLMVVLSSELNASNASMQRYEKQSLWVKIGDKIPVTLGRSGLGYVAFKEPLKKEGDGRSPAGLFPITSTFGYTKEPLGNMPYWYADEKLICIDDSNDTRYNQILNLDGEKPKSFEWMYRADGVYRYGAVIGYNTSGISGRGSCIFIHLNQRDKRPTSGCTAMDEAPLLELLKWLEPEKKPQMLQIVKSECEKYREEFPGIVCE